jgi:hypothetical protein
MQASIESPRELLATQKDAAVAIATTLISFHKDAGKPRKTFEGRGSSTNLSEQLGF